MTHSSVAIILASLALGACSQHNQQPDNTPQSITGALPGQPTEQSRHVAASLPDSLVLQPRMLNTDGELAVALSDQQWLTSGRKSGTRITGQPTPLVWSAGSEYLDYRQQGEHTRFVMLDQQKRLQLIDYQAGQLVSHTSTAPLTWAVEGLCLYQPAGQTGLQLFVLDDRAAAHQLLLTPKENQLHWQEIRQLPVAPESTFCSVDDISAQLFVSEETIGVWAYNAQPESEMLRTPVALVQPWGQLHHLAGPLAIQDGQLLIAEPGYLYRYRILERGAEPVSRYQLPANNEPDSLHVNTIGQQLRVSWLDEHSGQLQEQTLPDYRTGSPRTTAPLPELQATFETEPMTNSGDAADDPAIWVNMHKPAASRILGTNKQAGLMVYNLEGKQLQSLPAGRVNNVDVRQGFKLRGKPMDIAAASQRDNRAISLFAIEPTSGEVRMMGDIRTGLEDVYGLCMYQQQNEFYVFINDQDGRFEQWQIVDSQSGWQGQLRRTFTVNSQPEGCAADDQQQRLFIGEEDEAVWTLSANADQPAHMTPVARVGEDLTDDIEGMDIYRSGDQSWLVVSSQGSDSYKVYEATPPFKPVTHFRIGLNAEAGIDGASETDGLTVSSANLGPRFPAGLLVVQDGRNLLPDEAQNFKLVDWRSVQPLLNPPH